MPRYTITKIDKKLLSDKLLVKEEKFEDNDKIFLLEYQYQNSDDSSYIPTSKIYFSLDDNSNPMLFYQN